MNACVIGIDVGGGKKGFHVVAMTDSKFFDKEKCANPEHIVEWCKDHNAVVVAMDAPCGWSSGGSSREAERCLAKEGIHSFFTPTRQRAQSHTKRFYDWMLNGETLFRALQNSEYSLFQGNRVERKYCLETFPHAVTWAISGNKTEGKPKLINRQTILSQMGYDVRMLSKNIDFVDAALCAVAADAFRRRQYCKRGNREEGFIIIPKILSP
jgi:predicted nuclease with RNAse H fold